jgi:hypothetical protein
MSPRNLSPRNLPAFYSLLRRWRSFFNASVTAFFGRGKRDEWEPLFADDPRFRDEAYEVVFATTRSVN